MISVRTLMQLFVGAAKAWSDDLAPSMGAAISYYTVFSIAPLLVIVIAIAGAVFGHDAVQGAIAVQLSGLIGQQGAQFVQSLVAAADNTGGGLVAGGVSVIVLALGATSVFTELQDALDRIWHVPESQKPQGIWAILRARLLSFGLILGLVFLLMVSLVISAVLAALGTWSVGLLPGSETLLQFVNFAVSLAIMTALFAMIYKLMPSAQIAWEDVWVGAFATAVLFDVGKLAIGLYLGKSNLTASFQAAGSLVLLLAWVYYAAQVFLMGAEFTKVFAQERKARMHSGVAEPRPGTTNSQSPSSPRLVETPVSRARMEADHPAGLDAPILRAAEARTHAALARLLGQVIALAVLKAAGALVSRRRKAVLDDLGGAQRNLRWHRRRAPRAR